MNPTTRYLLGLIFVLALCLVALEWNTDGTGWAFFDTAADDLEAEMELSPLHREDDEVPMMVPQEPQEKMPPSQELNLVEEDVEIAPEVLEPVAPKEEDPKVEEKEELPEAVDMYDEPLDFRVVEDLPQFPGGAVEFMSEISRCGPAAQGAGQGGGAVYREPGRFGVGYPGGGETLCGV